jgi:predicted ATPase
MHDIERLFVITGGPGSGKTSLIEALARQGVPHMPEAGRAIIQAQVAIGGSALPWSDRLAFAELMFSHDLCSYRAALTLSDPVMFDRGVPDVLGYLKLIGLPAPRHIEQAARTLRYHRRVLIAPPWKAIFSQDAERKQSVEEAEATYQAMVDVYSSLGYELVPIPFASIPERVQFVRDIIG